VGQQQLLLIVLGLIIVALAITVAISVFRQGAIDSKRDIVTNECSNIASMALRYFKTPIPYGGGGGISFVGWQIPSHLITTPSGSYEATVYQDSVVIVGTGNEVVNGSDSIQVRTTVNYNSFSSVIIN
jgi:hypothetical protein